MSYNAPLKDMLFVMTELADLNAIGAYPGCEDATLDTVEAILEEHARFCTEVLAPLNRTGDKEPSRWNRGEVTTSAGFKEAFKSFGEAGWQGLQHPTAFGGQGLPKLVATACIEMLNAANLSFALCPLLSDSAIEALIIAGSDAQKSIYLSNLISGKWTGTMNLTEPQAGSDLAMVRTKAVLHEDGTYRVFGTKIYITYGEHDMAENIIHLVLARTVGAPDGVKGLSLFVVPKFQVDEGGRLGVRNDVHCLSIEHKLGIRASPTAVLQFGEQNGAVATLVGAENHGLETMFIMMNAARFAVGLQGIGVADRAYQKALAFSRERVQSCDLSGSDGPVTIIHHPDIRRMLLSMRSQIEAARALAYVTAAAFDAAHHAPQSEARKWNQSFYEFMVPVVKGWATEMSVEVASTGVQIHGGMGFIEETGAAQFYRDARILTIYEGTTAIQANDLISRKTIRDEGAVAYEIIARMRQTAQVLLISDDPDLLAISTQLSAATTAFEICVDYVLKNIKNDVKGVFAGSVLFLKLVGIVCGGWQMAVAADCALKRRISDSEDTEFYRAKLAVVRFYADHFLPQAMAYQHAITEGSSATTLLEESLF